MIYILITILFVLFGIEYRRRKKFETDIYIYVAQRINPVKAEMQNNAQASKNSYRKLEQMLDRANVRLLNNDSDIESLKRDMMLSGVFIKETK